ncbi:lipase family protein [Corynebacterium liangguodongii]|uniref:Triacylglycerol lipase n=1 Tax=Corynebacterium liangguodongii TaxID=2079535 RepID=A0A2S0WCT1_9CORY|nr:lipase family protein [Corynebacterium liangguodongii]AWB83578.1 triacylglycerol lipase [Corynebacterium liangguodongii]PWB98630.1 triacylglycerol lipase [Corynebacterium liangguodongii]
MRATFRVKTLAIGLAAAAASSATPVLATAQELSSVQGPHDGAPLGGSSIVQSGEEFFAPVDNLGDYAPGEVISTRTIPYHFVGLPIPVQVVQIKYRSTDHDDKPTYNITSVVKPTGESNGRLVSMHSVYDSLDPAHSPSRAIAGNIALGLFNSWIETPTIVQMLAGGYTVAVTDIEGQDANFFDGPTYGRLTLDGIRAAERTPETGLSPDAPVGLIGYSGGSIASVWAAQLAPTYAPDINARLVGSAAGGVPTNVLNLVNYIDGAPFWGPLTVMILIGLSRSYDFSLEPYLSDYGKHMVDDLSRATITEVSASFAGVDWASLFKPEYRDPRSIPEFVDAVNRNNPILAADPATPFFIGQANNGEITGTPTGPEGIGTGDGITVTGDTRALAHKYCEAGNPVIYHEYAIMEHTAGFLTFSAGAWPWLQDRFDGKPAGTNCGDFPAGNPAEPATTVPPAKGGTQEYPKDLAGLREFLKGRGSSGSSMSSR